MVGKIASLARSSTRGAILLGASCAVLALGAAGAAEAKLDYDALFEDGIEDFGGGATSVKFCWGGDYGEMSDSWFIRRAAGPTPPPADARPEAKLPGGTRSACYKARGLATGKPYTFRITGHDATGESEPAFITVAARRSGTYVRNGDSLERFPWFSFPQLAVTASDRRWHAIFPGLLSGKQHGTFYTSRGKRGWTKPQRVAGSLDSVFAANDAGALAVIWTAEGATIPRYRLKRSGASRFTARRTIPHATVRDHVGGAALDRRGRLHVLLSRDGTLLYVSNGSGSWRDQAITSRFPCDLSAYFQFCTRPAFLAYDSVSDRIVVAAPSTNGVAIATGRASAKTLGPLHPVAAANKRHLIATGLTSRANRVTLGLQSHPGRFPSEARGPLYVSTNGQLVRVPGTTANDWGLLVAAKSRDRVLLAWRRRSPIWDRSQQGIWTAVSVRDKRTGRWSIRNIRHRSPSHYDSLSSLAVTAAGRPLIAFKRG